MNLKLKNLNLFMTLNLLMIMSSVRVGARGLRTVRRTHWPCHVTASGCRHDGTHRGSERSFHPSPMKKRTDVEQSRWALGPRWVLGPGTAPAPGFQGGDPLRPATLPVETQSAWIGAVWEVLQSCVLAELLNCRRPCPGA